MSVEAAEAADRIDILDGLRGVAVLAVIGFHYFSRWTFPQNEKNLYPYGDVFANVPCFRFGYLGVNLFFLVSGFVITLTLTRCNSSREFFLKRFARLMPAMVLASSATFLIVWLLPAHFWTVRPSDFLPSLTFTDPYIYNRVLGMNSEFIDGAYWSLSVEVRFYALAAILYFGFSHESFLRNSAIAMNLAICFALLKHFAIRMPTASGIAEVLLFPKYAPWLFSGVAFYFIWKNRHNYSAWALVIVGLGINLLFSRMDSGGNEWLIMLGIYMVFGLFAIRANIMRILGARWLVRIGAASYVLYLLHQYIGVTAIASLSDAAKITARASLWLALIVFVCLALMSTLIFDRYEVPARRWLTRVGVKLLNIPKRTANPIGRGAF